MKTTNKNNKPANSNIDTTIIPVVSPRPAVAIATARAATSVPADHDASPDFHQIIRLLATYSQATTRLAEIETHTNRALLDLIDRHKPEYSTLQATCQETHAALEHLCRAHSEWFTAARSLKTPYGRVSFRNGASLSVRDDEATVKLLHAESERTHALHQTNEQTPVFPASDYIRTLEVPDLEALEKLDDETLKKFLITRVHADTFSVTPAAVNFSKTLRDTPTAKQN